MAAIFFQLYHLIPVKVFCKQNKSLFIIQIFFHTEANLKSTISNTFFKVDYTFCHQTPQVGLINLMRDYIYFDSIFFKFLQHVIQS